MPLFGMEDEELRELERQGMLPKGGFGGLDLGKDDKKQVALGRRILNAIYGPGAEKMSKSEMVVAGLQALGQGAANVGMGKAGYPMGPGALPTLQAITQQTAQRKEGEAFEDYVKGRISDPSTPAYERDQLIFGKPIQRDPMEVEAEKAAERQRIREERAAAEGRKAPKRDWETVGDTEYRVQWNPDTEEWEPVLRDGKPVTRQRYKDAKGKERDPVKERVRKLLMKPKDQWTEDDISFYALYKSKDPADIRGVLGGAGGNPMLEEEAAEPESSGGRSWLPWKNWGKAAPETEPQAGPQKGERKQLKGGGWAVFDGENWIEE